MRIRTPFWEAVEIRGEGDCWNWNRGRTKLGYGQCWDGTKVAYAHRQSWINARGKIPDGLCVLHKCDNPSCVNPNHLFLGTMRDNTRDMVSKARCYRPAAEKSKSRKLDWPKVDKIRQMWTEGISYKAIAATFSIGARNVYHIVSGERWKEFDRPRATGRENGGKSSSRARPGITRLLGKEITDANYAEFLRRKGLRSNGLLRKNASN